MPPTRHTHEQTINTALGEVLEEFGRSWSIRSENAGRVFAEGGRPDILIEKADGWPLVIEAEVGNYRQAEVEAQSRLGKTLLSSATTVSASVALVYPNALRTFDAAHLRQALREVTFGFVLFSTNAEGVTVRFPSSGWLQGGVAKLAMLLHRSSIPAWRVESLADQLETGISRAEGALSLSHSSGSALGKRLAELLGQTDDPLGQTRKMAMSVIANAFVFHSALADVDLVLPPRGDDPERSVESPQSLLHEGIFQPSKLLSEWERILDVNYWPIFHTASSLVRALPTRLCAQILNILWQTAEQLIVGGVTKSHDLTGVVFQRLIADRKFWQLITRSPPALRCLQDSLSPPHAYVLAGTGRMQQP